MNIYVGNLSFGVSEENIRQAFETGVFAELVKKYGRESVFYWRTKDKKEIDFILKMKDDLIPIEVKLNYEQFNPTAIRYFNEHYGIDHYRVVGLNGIQKDRRCVYPWDA